MLKKITLSLIVFMALCTGVYAESLRYDLSSQTLVNTGIYSVVKQGDDRFFSWDRNFVEGINLEKGDEIILLKWDSYANIKPVSYQKYTACKVVFTCDNEILAVKMDFLENETYVYPQLENKKGYEIKWNKTNVIDNVVTVNAEYIPIKYTVTFKVDGATNATREYTVEDKQIEIPAIPPKTGYTAHWEDINLDTGNVTVNAIYTPVEYTVTFRAGNFTENKKYTVEDMSITEPQVPEKKGYKGVWESYTLNYENITVEAVYTPIEYKVTFMDNGEFVKECTYTVENKTIEEPNVPEKAGYEVKWESYNLNDLSDITVNAVYNIILYTVTFKADGEDVAEENYTVEKMNINEPTVPVKEGYTGKWENYSLSLRDIVVEAQYTLQVYKVFFVANDKTVATENYTVENKDITEPPVPEKKGYEGKWESYNLTTGDITVSAEYTPKTYIISFDVNGGEEIDISQLGEGYYIENDILKIQVTYDEEYPVLPAPVHRDVALEFGGWKVNDAYVGNRVSVTEDSIFVANWTNKPKYEVRFTDYYGEEKPLISSVIEGEKIEKPENPYKKGYVFEYWCTDVNAENQYDFTTMAESAITLYPKWKAETYTVTFIADSQTVATENYTVENKDITEPAVPEKKGYTGVWESYSLEVGDVTVEAKYTLVDYVITFVADGNKVAEVKYNIENKNITAPNIVPKRGYTAKWEEYSIEYLGNITVNAIYTLIPYTVIFKADGEIVSEQTYTIEKPEIDNPTVPEKEHYTGVWQNYGLNCENIEVEAIYTPVAYTVTFIAEGRQIAVETYTIEKTNITAPQVVPKAGYEGKWENYSLEDFSNITVNAVYTPITYTVMFIADDVEVAKCMYTIETMEINPPDVPGKKGYAAKWESYSLNLSDITVKAVYTPIVYTVTFTDEGNVVAKETFTVENMNITEPEVPVKEGYKVEWQNYALTLDNIFVSAVYTPIDYKVTFKIEGKTVAEKTFNAENMSITEPTIPAKTGYTAKWESYNLEDLSNITVNAVYTPIVYTIIFADSNKVIATEKFTVENMSIIEPEVPVKEGYEGKWQDYTISLGNIYVYAEYTPIKYKAIFKADGKVVTEEIFTVENMNVTAPDVPAKIGYTAKWESYSLNLSDITINAVYTPVEYKVTFKANGTIVAEKTYTVENKYVTEPVVPERKGYKDGKWEEYSLENLGNITVEAVYKPIVYTIIFKADGKAVASRTYTIEYMKITVPQVPEKEGYFGEWESYSLDLSNITVNAVYTPKEKYTITFMADGNIVATRSYTEDNVSIDEPAVPAKDWYNGKWESYSLNFSNITINAVYTLATYEISFKADGVEVGSQSYDLNNQTVNLPAIPEKTGCRAMWEKYEVVPGGMTINVRYITQATDAENAEELYHYSNLVTDLGKMSLTGTEKKIVANIITVAQGIVSDIDYGIVIEEEHIRETYREIIKETKEMAASLTETKRDKLKAEIARKVRDDATYDYFLDFYEKYF